VSEFEDYMALGHTHVFVDGTKRIYPGQVIDCEDPLAMKAILFDKEMIANLKAENAFMDAISNRLQPLYFRSKTGSPFTYAKPKRKGWSTYQWVGFWNYAVLGTATVLVFLILHLLRVL